MEWTLVFWELESRLLGWAMAVWSGHGALGAVHNPFVVAHDALGAGHGDILT